MLDHLAEIAEPGFERGYLSRDCCPALFESGKRILV
jgi:hypothetical protein